MESASAARPQSLLDEALTSTAKIVHTYRLKFADDGLRPAKDVEFEAQDTSSALAIAHQIARNRSAELWCDGRRFCNIKSTRGGVWRIEAAPRPMSP